MAVDITAEAIGPIWILEGKTRAGRTWIQENLQGDETRVDEGFAVEPKFVAEILSGAFAEGLEVATVRRFARPPAPVIDIRMRPQTDEPPTLFDLCWRCDAPLVWLLAEAGNPNGRLWHRLWRCTTCEAVTRTGWRPPCWINKTQEVWMRLRDELDDGIENTYTPTD